MKIVVSALMGCHWRRSRKRPDALGELTASNAARASLRFKLVCCYFATAIVYLFFKTLKYYFLIRKPKLNIIIYKLF